MKALVRDRRTLAFVLPLFRELRYRLDHPCWKYKPDDHPDRNQLGFHRAPQAIRLLYGGNQSGKSRAGAQEVAWWARGVHPYQDTPCPARVYVISANYRTVQEGIYKHLIEVIPRWEIEGIGPRLHGYTFHGYIILKNGSRIDFLTAEGREDSRRSVQAAEIDLAVVDEEIDESIWKELQRRRLARGGRVVVCATLHRSEQWCLELEDIAEVSDELVHLTRLSTYQAMAAGHVSEKVVREIEATHSEADIKVTLLGQSRRHEGLIYPEFCKDHIVEPFDIPRSWTRYCALDPGFRTFAVLWVAVAPDEKYYVYRELYLHARHWKNVAEAILAAEGWRKTVDKDTGVETWLRGSDSDEIHPPRWIDPSAFGNEVSGELKVGSLFSIYSHEMGLGSELCPAPANNDVMVGIEFCRRSLQRDMDGIPRARVFRTCDHFIKEIRNYRIRKDDRGQAQSEPADRPVKRGDHLLDAWRYLENMGLRHVKDKQPWEKTEVESGHMAPRFSVSMDDRIKDHWNKMLRKFHDKRQGGNTPQHPGGLGGEY